MQEDSAHSLDPVTGTARVEAGWRLAASGRFRSPHAQDRVNIPLRIRVRLSHGFGATLATKAVFFLLLLVL